MFKQVWTLKIQTDHYRRSPRALKLIEMQFLAESLVELITQTSTNLPPDVREAMSRALGTELPNTQSSQALNVIASNIDMAAEDQGPICQDTGMPTFVVHTPGGGNQIVLKRGIQGAVGGDQR